MNLKLTDRQVRDLDHKIMRYGQLLSDLKALRKGHEPSPSVLELAPTLENWSYTTRPVSCLSGLFFDHPKIDDWRPGITSEVFFIDAERGFVRTRSRFYTLGSKASETA
ncbi:hypothetical protein [Rhizobium sp. ZW T2_16]|uniref:hypothetical protein n=1 Tax=Rhizobium sp. ZW T2_16 TaxID=3378083 RepID=UPI003852C9BB